jgi:hypothetical protein
VLLPGIPQHQDGEAENKQQKQTTVIHGIAYDK